MIINCDFLRATEITVIRLDKIIVGNFTHYIDNYYCFFVTRNTGKCLPYNLVQIYWNYYSFHKMIAGVFSNLYWVRLGIMVTLLN